MKKAEQKNWQNVLPIAILVVVIGLGLALYWFSPVNQTQLVRDISFAVTPEWVQIDGINQRFIGCGRYAECDSNWVQVYDNNAYFLPIDPQIEFDGYYPGAGIIVETPGSPMSSTLMTVTPYPICTAVPCASGQYYCPGCVPDEPCYLCPGGCGVVCVEPTATCPGIADLAGNCMEQVIVQFTVPSPTPAPNYEIVEWDVDVRPYYRGLGQDGKPKDLNERNTHTLYNYSDGYRLPHCDFYPEPKDFAECSQYPTHLLYIVHVTSGQPVDRNSYWGAINGSTYICLYAQGVWYTDWRPDW